MTNDAKPAIGRGRLRRDMAIAAACGVLVAGMVGASFAAIPLYKIFCSVTGFAVVRHSGRTSTIGPFTRVTT